MTRHAMTKECPIPNDERPKCGGSRPSDSESASQCRWSLVIGVWVLLGYWCLGIGQSRADEALTRVTFPGESSATSRRLADADKLASEGKWAVAVAEYQRLLDEAGDELVAVTPSRSVQARFLCQQRFVALPAAALRLYRDKVDARARRWLEQG